MYQIIFVMLSECVYRSQKVYRIDINIGVLQSVAMERVYKVTETLLT